MGSLFSILLVHLLKSGIAGLYGDSAFQFPPAM